MHWGKFADAKKDLLRYDGMKDSLIFDCLNKSKKFVFEAAVDAFRDRNDLIKLCIDYLKLPFDDIALLYKCKVPKSTSTDGSFGGPRYLGEETWAIAIAQSADSVDFGVEFNSRLGEILPSGFSPRMWVSEFILLDGHWLATPYAVLLSFDDADDSQFLETALRMIDGNGIPFDDKSEPLPPDQIVNCCSVARYAISTLCITLAANNVEKKLIEAPKFLNRKRLANGNLPLEDYHVLVVDGEMWHGKNAGDGDGPGYRSHFRRGFFRRLESDRYKKKGLVFVRACVVKGKLPGFVDKEYEVRA